MIIPEKKEWEEGKRDQKEGQGKEEDEEME